MGQENGRRSRWKFDAAEAKRVGRKHTRRIGENGKHSVVHLVSFFVYLNDRADPIPITVPSDVAVFSPRVTTGTLDQNIRGYLE